MNSPDAATIVENVHFFKVAHHGSHNATPKSAPTKKMHDGFPAMISTQNVPWPSIPFEKMLSQLERKAAAIVRSNSIPMAQARKKAPKGPALDLKPGFHVGPFWTLELRKCTSATWQRIMQGCRRFGRETIPGHL